MALYKYINHKNGNIVFFNSPITTGLVVDVNGKTYNFISNGNYLIDVNNGNVLLSASQQQLWTPALISTNIWFDASDSNTITEVGGAVSQWDDKSGNNVHLIQADGARQPITGAVSKNDLNVLDFTLDGMSTGSFDIHNGNGSFMIFCVSNMISITNNARLIDLNGTPAVGYTIKNATSTLRSDRVNGATHAVLDVPYDLGEWRLWGFTWDSGNVHKYYKEGNEVANGGYTLDLGQSQQMFISQSSTNIYSNETLCAEIIIVDNVDTTTRQLIEGYLAHKWGLTVTLPSDHPYKSLAPII